MEMSKHRIAVGKTVAHCFLRSMVQNFGMRSSTIHSMGNIRGRAVELTEPTDHKRLWGTSAVSEMGLWQQVSRCRELVSLCDERRRKSRSLQNSPTQH